MPEDTSNDSATATDVELPMQITDSIGDESKRATWTFCGKFPLDKIASGRRACRHGWRSRNHDVSEGGDELSEAADGLWDMLAVRIALDGKSTVLVLVYESAGYEEEQKPFHHIDDMLSEDWYLEDERPDKR